MAETQLSRYWPHNDKWDATRGTFMFYIGQLKKEAYFQSEMHKEGSSIAKIKERAGKFLTIMYMAKINSGTSFNENADIKKLKDAIKSKHEKKKKKPTDVQSVTTADETPKGSDHQKDPSKTPHEDKDMGVPDDDSEIDSKIETKKYCTSDGVLINVPVDSLPKKKVSVIERDPKDPDDPDGADTDIDNVQKGDNWEPCLPLRRIGEYLQNLLEASLMGQPLEVIQISNHERARNGFVSLQRLADVYGRGIEVDAMGPSQYLWGQQGSDLPRDWAGYKILIDGGGYLTQYPNFDAIVCGAARRGFTAYHDHKRLTDWLRTVANEFEPNWDHFRSCVDKFLGDYHRSEYNERALINANGLMAMDTSVIWELQPTGVNQVSLLPATPIA